jgi:hypothetical protein
MANGIGGLQSTPLSGGRAYAMPDTTPLAAARVSLFAHAYSPLPVATLTLPEAIERIATGKYRSQVCEVRQVLARDGQCAYRKAKNSLPAFTFGGTFAPKRGIAHLQQHSRIIHGDLDHLPDVKADKRTICSDPRTVYTFMSPSSGGLKIGVRGPLVADGAGYEHAWRVVSAEYTRLHGIAWDQDRSGAISPFIWWHNEVCRGLEEICSVKQGFGRRAGESSFQVLGCS